MQKDLEISHVTHEGSRGGLQVSILKNVSYRFRHGHSYALTGVSGTGKSTLIHLLTGLESPTSGQVYCGEQDIYALSPQERSVLLQQEFGIIFQAPYLIDELSVVENVMLKGLIAQEDFAQAHEKALLLLDQVGLLDKEGQRPRSLSGGEQQRVAIARALYGNPSWIIADEPTAHLDRVASIVIADLLLSFQQQTGAGLIVASHTSHLINSLETVLEVNGGMLEDRSQSHVQAAYYSSQELQ